MRVPGNYRAARLVVSLAFLCFYHFALHLLWKKGVRRDGADGSRTMNSLLTLAEVYQ